MFKLSPLILFGCNLLYSFNQEDWNFNVVCKPRCHFLCSRMSGLAHRVKGMEIWDGGFDIMNSRNFRNENYPFPKVLGLVAQIPCWRDKKYGSTHLN